jgi:hypothetical protein
MSKRNNIAGTSRYNVSRKVVRLRTKDLLSWREIANTLEISPKLARKLFQERIGEHQHHDHLPNKGGRFPNYWTTTAEVPYLDGKGNINSWEKVYGSDVAQELASA